MNAALITQEKLMKQLQWHEPAAYRRALFLARMRSHPMKSQSLAFAAAVFAAMLALRAIVDRNPEAHPPGILPSIAIALMIALVAVYGLPLFITLLPGSIVILSEKGVNNNVILGWGVRIHFWAWEKISYCVAGVQTVNGNSYQIITLHGSNDEALTTVALAQKPTLNDVAAYLASRDKPFHNLG